jgi:hypothetical protein
VAGHAPHAGRPHAACAALHGWLVHVHVFSLPRRIVGGMTIETTRAQDNFARLLKQRHRAAFLLFDLVELLDRRKRA